jgi:hypothetical protein
MMSAGEAVVGSAAVLAVEVGAAEAILVVAVVDLADLADLAAVVEDLMAVAQEAVGNTNASRLAEGHFNILSQIFFYPDNDIPGFLSGLNIGISLY